MRNELFESLIALAFEAGTCKANIIDAKEIVVDRTFRDMCVSNACGVYGKCYMCPPDVGDIDILINEIKKYDYALVYQTVTELEDSFDFEGMAEAKKSTYPIAQNLRQVFKDKHISTVLHLGAGGCGV